MQIKVNGEVTRLLQPIDDVVSVEILHFVGVPIGIPKEHTKAITEWLYNLTQRATGTVVYNGTIIEKDSIKDPDEVLKHL